jgi:hypothetical protein
MSTILYKIDDINTENFHPKDDFLDRLIKTKSLKFVYITLLKTLTHHTPAFSHLI